MLRFIACLVAIALSFGIAGEAFGGTITVAGDYGDGSVDVNGLPQNFDLPVLRVGTGGNNVRGHASIFFFALPALPSPGALAEADLTLNYLGIAEGSPGVFGIPEFNADLFGIGARSTPTILSTDYHDGNASASTDTLIAQGFITPSTAPGTLHATGNSLLPFLQSLYDSDGTPTAAFVVFRVNADIHLPPNSGRLRGYNIASADNTDNGGNIVPQLTLTTAAVPEPSTLALAFGAGLFFVGGYWRRSCNSANVTES
jgi:hypothetical protein